MKPIDWQYIGDGVYASCDGFHVILVTNSPRDPENKIYLEDTVVADLIQFLKKIGFMSDNLSYH